jgi:hypothetical protein
MKHGIFIPPLAVRLAVGAVAAALLAVAASQAPDVWRYIKIERM